VRSLRDDHFVCLNHALMRQLGTIGQALYMRLFFHFANLYTNPAQPLTFQKRYDDICAEWLGGLSVHPQRSIVEHNQLGPHLRQLVAAGFLASYDIAKAKNTAGLVLAFTPGQSFFDDYDRFYRRRARSAVGSEPQPDQPETGDPLKLAYLFAEKRTGHPVSSIAFVNSKDVQTAKQFLTEITIEEAPSFLDFALEAASRTNFNVQTLGGLRQYLAPYKARQAAVASTEQREIARTQEENDRLAYDRYRRAAAGALFQSLPASEQETIEQLAERAAARFGGSLRAAMRNVYRAQVAAQRHPDAIKTLAEWKATA
jgi:hypothetical protein